MRTRITFVLFVASGMVAWGMVASGMVSATTASAEPDLGTPLPGPGAMPALSYVGLGAGLDTTYESALPNISLGNGMHVPRRAAVLGGMDLEEYYGGRRPGWFGFTTLRFDFDFNIAGGAGDFTANGTKLDDGNVLLMRFGLPSLGYGFRGRKWLAAVQLQPNIEWFTADFQTPAMKYATGSDRLARARRRRPGVHAVEPRRHLLEERRDVRVRGADRLSRWFHVRRVVRRAGVPILKRAAMAVLLVSGCYAALPPPTPPHIGGTVTASGGTLGTWSFTPTQVTGALGDIDGIDLVDPAAPGRVLRVIRETTKPEDHGKFVVHVAPRGVELRLASGATEVVLTPESCTRLDAIARASHGVAFGSVRFDCDLGDAGRVTGDVEFAAGGYVPVSRYAGFLEATDAALGHVKFEPDEGEADPRGIVFWDHRYPRVVFQIDEGDVDASVLGQALQRLARGEVHRGLGELVRHRAVALPPAAARPRGHGLRPRRHGTRRHSTAAPSTSTARRRAAAGWSAG